MTDVGFKRLMTATMYILAILSGIAIGFFLAAIAVRLYEALE